MQAKSFDALPCLEAKLDDLALSQFDAYLRSVAMMCPPDVVQRSFDRSLNNFFNLYAPLADEWALHANSLAPLALPVATQLANKLSVTEPATWRILKKLNQVV